MDEKGRERNLKDEVWKWLQERGGAERRPRYWDDPRFHRAGYPVVGVTWYEASAYCKWLTEKNRHGDAETRGRGEEMQSNFQFPTSNLQFRLPTELEWVRAAGGEENGRYPWDSSVIARSEATKQSPTSEAEIASQKTLAMTLARANVEESDLGGTTPVAMYPDGARVMETGETIFDLAGNVWEWTSNVFEKDYPRAYMRGASYYVDAEYVRASARTDDTRNDDATVNGLRVVAAS